MRIIFSILMVAFNTTMAFYGYSRGAWFFLFTFAFLAGLFHMIAMKGIIDLSKETK